MRSLAIIFLIIIFSAATIPCISVIAEPVYPPHEDPATAQSVMDANSFLTCYTDIFTLMSLKNYANATMLIEQLKFVHIPEDLRYIIQRYNNLTLELTQILDNLEKLLNKASTLLNQYRLNETSQTLSEAGILVAKAEILLNDIQGATETLSARFGIFAAPAESKVREAYNTLQSLLQRLKQLIEDYLKLLKSIRNKTSEIQSEELKPTTVTLNLNATKVFVGEPVEASGTLTTNGEGLPNRTITLLFDDNPVATATTGLDGSYHATVATPYKYVHNMTAKALYTPLDADRGVYLASLSPPISIEVMFNETRLEITAPDEAYPGLPITVRGNVTSEGGTPLNQRRVGVFLDNNLLAYAETNHQGFLETEATLSPETPTGKHTMTIAVDPQGIYAGVSQEKTLSIVKIPSEISIHVPSLIILPAKMYVEGNASASSGPLQDATITLQLGENSTIVMTSKNGEFNATIGMPLNLIFAGFQGLRVTVEPAEPWHAPTQAKASIFVINPANLGLASAAFISIGAVLYTRLTGAKRREKEGKVLGIALPPLEKSLPTIFLKSEVKFEGVKGRILQAYVKALKIVERATAISITPQMTIREFLRETKPKLEGAANSFTELTFFAELTLYSQYVPAENVAERAEDLTRDMEGVLRRGTA